MSQSRKWKLTLGILALGFLSAMFRGGAQAQVVSENLDGWNLSVAPGADILSSSLTPATRGVTDTTYRFMVGIAGTSSDSVLYLHVVKPGDVYPSVDLQINGGNPLSAGLVYNFEFNASATFTYNLRVATTTKIALITFDRRVN